jgi:hypothetical protein
MSDISTASPALPASEAKPLPSPIGIGGWLLLPALVMVISPLRIAYDFYQTFSPILKPTIWILLLRPGNPLHNPPLAALLAWEIIANAAFFAFTIWLAFLFFKKRKNVPKLYIYWLLLSCALQIADLFFSSFVPIVADQSHANAFKELAKAAIGAAIWMPYFLKSKRVKNTFVNEARASDGF